MMRRNIFYLIIVAAGFFVADFAIERVLLHGVNESYGLNQHSDMLIVGHSHIMLATDKVRLEKEIGIKVSKYTREGVNVGDRKIMVKQYLDSPYSDSLKICLYGVDLCTFTGEGLSENSYKLFYPFMDNQDISEYIHQQASSDDYWLHKIVRTNRYNDDGLKNSSITGWLHDWQNRKTGQVDVEAYKKRLAAGDERHIQMNEELIAAFCETVNMLTAKGVKVILVNTPTLDLLNEFEPEKYDMMMSWFTDYAKNNDMIEFWDFNPEFASGYDLMRDRLHVNVNGQQVITSEIIKRLKNHE